MDFKLFYQKNKDLILIITAVVVGVFLLFYWTHLFFQSKRTHILSKIEAKKEQLVKASELYKELQNVTQNGYSNVTGGLLSFVQSFGKTLQIEKNITSLKPRPAADGLEGISVRIEQLSLSDLLNIVSMLEKYNNISIEVFNLSKRFDNPMRADIYMEIIKVS